MPAPRLHPDTIDQVTQRLDLVDIASEHVVLRKMGTRYRGACPFHRGNNPTSFSIDPMKQTYHCFTCQAGGGAIKFLMELNKQSFQEVVIDLARRYGVAVRTLEPEQSQELQRQMSRQEQLYEMMALATSFYQHALFAPQGREALAYLTETRHLSRETIQKFQLGYAPAGWDTLYGYLVEHKRLPVALVEAAGLIVPRKTGSGYYDRFRDRAIVPICDVRGRPIALGGRSLGDGEPKYLNSPETELFSKGSVLFALDKARDAIARADRAIVVEGYFDAIALHQAGICEAVASMGVALSGNHLRQLLRYTESKQLYLNFDADKAGIDAAQRAVEGFKASIYDGTVKLRVVVLPDGKDADEFLRRHDAAAYRKLLEEAPLFPDWQIDRILDGQDLSRADRFQECSLALSKLLANFPDAFLRTHYIYTCAQRLARGNPQLALRLENDFRRQLRHSRWYGHKNLAPATPTSALQVAETQLLQIFLHFPAHRRMVWAALQEEEIAFSLSHHRTLWQAIAEQVEADEFVLDRDEEAGNRLVQHLQMTFLDRPELSQQLSHLLWLDDNARIALLRPAMVVRAAIAKIQSILSEKRYRYWRDLWEKTDVTADPERGRFYQTKIQEEKSRMLELQKQIEVSFSDLTGMENRPDGWAADGEPWDEDDAEFF